MAGLNGQTVRERRLSSKPRWCGLATVRDSRPPPREICWRLGRRSHASPGRRLAPATWSQIQSAQRALHPDYAVAYQHTLGDLLTISATAPRQKLAVAECTDQVRRFRKTFADVFASTSR
jgi:hypothetical protein